MISIAIVLTNWVRIYFLKDRSIAAINIKHKLHDIIKRIYLGSGTLALVLFVQLVPLCNHLENHSLQKKNIKILRLWLRHHQCVSPKLVAQRVTYF